MWFSESVSSLTGWQAALRKLNHGKPSRARYLICIKQWLASQEEGDCRMTFERLLSLINLLLPPSWMNIITSWRSPMGHHCCISLLQHGDGLVQVGVGVGGAAPLYFTISIVILSMLSSALIHMNSLFRVILFCNNKYLWKKAFNI